ncbi:predicted protein [Verticillium alfalfae VaMs.102]|uniref:Predicted protein n=1 Tax=Verticillium alfalfae (strain VaMs.102 / ATCC MYA-4576 / FGSC 10136) TaxID=526221 RepID=C9SV16_VERA1|nr:predicted protein [Verticillium alfalfae VaMs.102]EEY22631.1 predicted protein [Verticillium alfalfae VaMs.102]
MAPVSVRAMTDQSGLENLVQRSGGRLAAPDWPSTCPLCRPTCGTLQLQQLHQRPAPPAGALTRFPKGHDSAGRTRHLREVSPGVRQQPIPRRGEAFLQTAGDWGGGSGGEEHAWLEGLHARQGASHGIWRFLSMRRSSGRRRRARSSGISGLLGAEAACARIDEPRGDSIAIVIGVIAWHVAAQHAVRGMTAAGTMHALVQKIYAMGRVM